MLRRRASDGTGAKADMPRRRGPVDLTSLTHCGHHPLPVCSLNSIPCLVLSLGEPMMRPDKAHSKAAKKQRRKTSSPRAPKAALRRGPVTIGKETNVARLSRELSEASEQQAATAEILSVISNS